MGDGGSGGHGLEILESGVELLFVRLVVDCGLAWTRFCDCTTRGLPEVEPLPFMILKN
jgi:hypothetical protein